MAVNFHKKNLTEAGLEKMGEPSNLNYLRVSTTINTRLPHFFVAKLVTPTNTTIPV